MVLLFKDHLDFTPDLTPYEMFNAGIIGGSYFRNIKSPKTNISYTIEDYKQFKFLLKIPLHKLITQNYDKTINKYKVKAGSSYKDWVSKGWIDEEIDPRGWIQWYCNFYNGRRTPDDLRQINRWKKSAGPKGRFRNQLQRKINEVGKNDEKIYPRLRQTLLHWGLDSRKLKVK